MSIFLMKLIREETEHKIYQTDIFSDFRFAHYRSDERPMPDPGNRIQGVVPTGTYRITVPPTMETNWHREYLAEVVDNVLITREEAIQLLNPRRTR